MSTISPGMYQDSAENNKIIEVIGTALDECTLSVLVLWREQNNKQIWAKQLTHWNALLDNGQKRFKRIKE
jgi:hypothetical protein